MSPSCSNCHNVQPRTGLREPALVGVDDVPRDSIVHALQDGQNVQELVFVPVNQARDVLENNCSWPFGEDVWQTVLDYQPAAL